MKKRALALMAAGVVAVGVFVGAAYAKENISEKTKDQTKPVNTQFITNKNDLNKTMIKIMRENGYEDLVKALEKGDYDTLDKFMSNISDEDYKKMIDIMRKSGYESMADMMESIGRENMIQMHNAMGGAESCHGNSGTYNGMMRNVQ